MNVMKNVFNRVFFLYLVTLLGIGFLTHFQEVIRSAKLQTLSRLTPSFDYYAEIMAPEKVLSLERLEECAYYHERVADFVLPSAAEAMAVAAVCRYEKGQVRKAREYLNKSILKVPVFFWNYYNLGVLALNDGDLKGAAEAFSKAVNLDPQHTLLIEMQSKVYKDIRRSSAGYDLEPQARLAEGYRRAMMFLKFSMLCHNDPQAELCSKLGRLHMQIF